MLSELNYPLAITLLILFAILLIFFIRRNAKDKKKFEKESIESDLKPDKHESDRI